MKGFFAATHNRGQDGAADVKGGGGGAGQETQFKVVQDGKHK